MVREPAQQGGVARAVIGEASCLAAGVKGGVEMIFGDIDAGDRC